MNTVKTAMPLAALTALFGVAGYMLGGATGLTMAFGLAVATNLFVYWNSDRMALFAHPATASLFIIDPLSGQGMDNLFSTHPATENRIAALQALAAGMETARQGGFFPQVSSNPAPSGGFMSQGPWGSTTRRKPWG